MTTKKTMKGSRGSIVLLSRVFFATVFIFFRGDISLAFISEPISYSVRLTRSPLQLLFSKGAIELESGLLLC